MALVPMIMWGVLTALVNFSPQEFDKPEMITLILYHCGYALEMALGLLLIKLGLSCKSKESCCEVKND